MAEYEITLTVEAPRKSAVEKKLQAAFGEDGEEVPIHSIEKVDTPSSRAERLSEAQGLVSEAMEIVSALRDEMEQWYDSIPENLQEGNKALEVQEAQDALDAIHSDLEAIDFDGVSFPGMY